VNNQQQKVMELVVFKLNPGVNTTAFKEAVDEMNKVLKRDIPGFLERSLLHTPDEDQWVDVIYWSTMEQALGAFEIVEKKREFEVFASFIDMQQTSMYHLVPAL
jgi:heme-degrading monooxygenase HmoA